MKELLGKVTPRGVELCINRPIGFVGEPDLSAMIAAGQLYRRLPPATVAKVLEALEISMRHADNSGCFLSRERITVRSALALLNAQPTKE